MTALAVRVLADIRRLRLVGAGDRVVAALSGGPDSVALTCLLAELLPRLDATLAGAAHLHHGLRGADADEDASFCAVLADRLGVPLLVDRVDAAAFAREHGVSLEVAGHRLRMAFFDRARWQADARLVATGHTVSDQAETFLLRAARGAGVRGLGGMRVARPGLIRPLLGVSRTEILQYLEAIGQGFREDGSNADRRYPRNRVRHDVLPVLARALSPRVEHALARTARLAADDDRFLRRLATRVGAPFVIEEEGGRVRLKAAGVLRLPLALRRRVVLDALDRLSGSRATASAVEMVLDSLARADKEAIVVAGGVWATRSADDLLLERGGRQRPGVREAATAAVTGLPVPGSARVGRTGTIEAARVGRDEAPTEPSDPCRATLDAGRVTEPLSIRFRRPGDRLTPLGMPGRKKLQDLFVDLKVPRHQRDDVPLVVDADGRIVWVAGHVIAHDARVTSATTSVLVLNYRR